MNLLFSQTADGLIFSPNEGVWHFMEEKGIFERLLSNENVVFDAITWSKTKEEWKTHPFSRILVISNPNGEMDEETGVESVANLHEAARILGADMWLVGDAETTREALPNAKTCVVVERNVLATSGDQGPSFSQREWTIVMREGRQSKTGTLYTVITRTRRMPHGDMPLDFEMVDDTHSG